MNVARIDLIDTSGRGLPDADRRMIERLVAASVQRAICLPGAGIVDGRSFPALSIQLIGVGHGEVLHLAERLRANLHLPEVGVEIAGRYHLLDKAGEARDPTS